MSKTARPLIQGGYGPPAATRYLWRRTATISQTSDVTSRRLKYGTFTEIGITETADIPGLAARVFGVGDPSAPNPPR